MNELISPDRLSSGKRWADPFRRYRQPARGHSRGLEQDASEVCVFKGLVAVETIAGAGLSPGVSLRDTGSLWTDTSNQRTAAASSGELFDVGTGTATSNGYLKDPGGSLPLSVVREDVCCATKSMNPSLITTNAVMTVNRQHEAMVGAVENEPAAESNVVRVPTSEADPDSLVVMICILFRRCADELSRASSRLRPLETGR